MHIRARVRSAFSRHCLISHIFYLDFLRASPALPTMRFPAGFQTRLLPYSQFFAPFTIYSTTHLHTCYTPFPTATYAIPLTVPRDHPHCLPATRPPTYALPALLLQAATTCLRILPRTPHYLLHTPRLRTPVTCATPTHTYLRTPGGLHTLRHHLRTPGLPPPHTVRHHATTCVRVHTAHTRAAARIWFSVDGWYCN